ncbi:hypothetical protein EB796_001017 [Bugula neritina]|uniref:Uncharacterized protein n=1 Tax=Bugula neritina TaxID=10212 RepID=A0A7J7KRB2_BUGNE|nr:hypothetical protein EB796_001017 [Bugula neritina]
MRMVCYSHRAFYSDLQHTEGQKWPYHRRQLPKLNQWIEHYNLPVQELLDISPDLSGIVQNLQFGKASGSDEISAELLKDGLGILP